MTHRGPVAWVWPKAKGLRGSRKWSLYAAEMRATRAASERQLVVALLMRLPPARLTALAATVENRGGRATPAHGTARIA